MPPTVTSLFTAAVLATAALLSVALLSSTRRPLLPFRSRVTTSPARRPLSADPPDPGSSSKLTPRDAPSSITPPSSFPPSSSFVDAPLSVEPPTDAVKIAAPSTSSPTPTPSTHASTSAPASETITHLHDTRTPPRADQTQVAVCLTGNVRTFAYPTVHTSILRSLINPLLANDSLHVDVFFNVKLPDTPVTASTPTDATSGPFHAVAARRFHPVFVRELALHDNLQPRLAKRTGEDGGSQMLEKPSPMCDDRMYYGVISVPDSLFRYGQCGQAIAEYEAIQADRRRNSNGTTTEVPIKYDYVYALRPDIWMHGSVMLPHEIANNTLYTNMSPTGITAPFRQWYALAFPDDANNSAAVPHSGDKLLAGGREAFNVAMRAYTSVDTCDPYRFIAHLGPEMTLLRWMQVNKVGVDVMEKVAVSVARMSHVECFVVDALPESRVTEAWRTEARDMCVRASGLVGREREEDGEREANRE